MEINYRDLPDDRWQRAAEVALAALHKPLTDAAAARLVISPWRSEDGPLVPFLLRVEPRTADGTESHPLTAVVLGDRYVNDGGAAAATGVLAAAGFPTRPIALGHLLDVLVLTGTVNSVWRRPPSSAGWVAALQPGYATSKAPELEYTERGAVLHLFRISAWQRLRATSGPPNMPLFMPPAPIGNPPPPWLSGNAPAGSASLAPVIERLSLSFDDGAAFTISTALERTDGSWEPIDTPP